MGRPSREKGKRGEREAAAELARLFVCEARRAQQYSGADHTADLLTSLEGIHFEVKRTETLSVYKAIDQAVSDAGDNCPAVLHRRNGKPWLAIVRLDDLPLLARKLAFESRER